MCYFLILITARQGAVLGRMTTIVQHTLMAICICDVWPVTWLLSFRTLTKTTIHCFVHLKHTTASTLQCVHRI